MARFQVIAEGGYFFLMLQQFLVSFDFFSIYGQGLKPKCTPSCVTASGVTFKNSWNQPFFFYTTDVNVVVHRPTLLNTAFHHHL